VKPAFVLFALAAVLSARGVTPRENIAALKELLAIPSVSTNIAETDRAVLWMRDYLTARGVWCVVETSSVDGRKVLYAATKPGLKNPDYTLVTHLDVVAGKPEQFEPFEKDGRLYARGACDTKGNAFGAALTLVRLNGKGSVGCLFSANEEIGGSSTKHLVDLGYGVPGKAVIVLDASDMPLNIGIACKGCSYYRVTAVGKAGHSSSPWKCENPIYILAEAALKIRDRYPHQKPGEYGNSAAVTIIGGGDAQNKIPGTAEMTVNVRFTDKEDGIERNRKLIEEITGLKTETIRGTYAAVSDPSAPEIRRVQALRRERYPEFPNNLVKGNGANDSRYFGQFGKPMMSSAMRHSGGHADEEWLEIADLEHFVDYLTDVCQCVEASAR